MPLHDAMFCEPSPAPAKYAVSLLGLCTREVRLPLVELTETTERVREAMRSPGSKLDVVHLMLTMAALPGHRSV